jgi:hypothetical protein
MRTIHFADIVWDVKCGKHGPGIDGKNNWCDDHQSVWVDHNGWLHLKIRKIGDTWYSAEVTSQAYYGYGEYLFYVDGKIDDYDPVTVLGTFSYLNDLNEIDIEVANFNCGLPKYINHVVHVLQPNHDTNVTERTVLDLEEVETSHKYTWLPSGISWESYKGHDRSGTPAAAIFNTSYSGDRPQPKSPAKIHINFWLQKLSGPQDGKEAEVVIRNVFFKEYSGS